ncbi:MAG TPA: hypothetical protein PLD77_02625 [Candidatus Dojkabacteria bacterium]|nr:hypothetical protein [Candidatus Dojkabacteria bacterium]
MENANQSEIFNIGNISLSRPLQAPIFVKESEASKNKFSILDVMVVISAFIIVGCLVYLFFNPNKQGSESRNFKREADISMILSSIYSYTKEHGEIPKEIPVTEQCMQVGNEICKTGPHDCTGLVNLDSIVQDSEGNGKIISLPSDPESRSVNGTGYFISQDGRGNITVCAPYAERNVTLSFTKYMF